MYNNKLFQYFSLLSFFIFSPSLVYGIGLVSAPVGCTTYLVYKTLCAGHGECRLYENETYYNVISEGEIPGSQCVCDSEWSGVNDWVNMEGHDCGTSLIAIRIIWVLILISVGIELSMIGYKLLQAVRTLQIYLLTQKNDLADSRTVTKSDSKAEFKLSEEVAVNSEDTEENQGFLATSIPLASEDPPSPSSHNRSTQTSNASPPSQNRSTQNSNGLFNTKQQFTNNSNNNKLSKSNFDILLLWCQWPIVRVCLIALLGAICQLIVCFIRIVHPEYVLGVVWGVSIAQIIRENAFIFAERVMSSAWLDVRSKVLRFTEQNEKVAATAIYRFRQSFYFSFIIDCIRGLLLIFIHIYPQERNLLFLLSRMFLIATIILGGITTVRSGRVIESILSDGLEMLQGKAKTEREKTLVSLRRNLKAHQNSIYSTTIIALVNGWWPLLRARQSYIMVQTMIIGILITLHLLALHPPKVNTFKNAKGSKNKPSSNAKNRNGANGGERGDELGDGGEGGAGRRGKSEEVTIEEKKLVEKEEEKENNKMEIQIELISSPTELVSSTEESSTHPLTAPMTPEYHHSPNTTTDPVSSSVSSHPLVLSHSQSELAESRNRDPSSHFNSITNNVIKTNE